MKQMNEQSSSGQAGNRSSLPEIEQHRHLEQRQRSNRLHSRSSATFSRLIEACKHKELNVIAKLLFQRPELVNQCDRFNRTLLHYTAIKIVPDITKRYGSDNSDDDEDRESVCNGRGDYEDEAVNNDDQADRNESSPNQNPKRSAKQRSHSMSKDSKSAKFIPSSTSDRRDSDSNNNSKQQRDFDDQIAIDCIRYLTDRCDPKLWSQLDSDGLSILHLAVISSNENIVRFLIYEHEYSNKWPLINVSDSEKHTPLHWAVITNSLKCVKMLIEAKSNCSGVSLAHKADINGATPIHYATQTSEYPKYRRHLRQMLIRGALANSCEDGSRAHMKAPVDVGSRPGSSKQQQQKQQPWQSDADATTDSSSQCRNELCHRNKEQYVEILAYLVRLRDINLECRDKDHRTPLLWAASSGNRAAIELLVTYGADLNCVDANRLGALHCAASHGYTDCLESLLAIASKRQHRAANNANLTDNNLNVDQVDNLNCTPLFYAVLSGNIDCIEILLDKGAKIDWQDAKGRSAAHFAALKGQLNALKLLNSRGGNLWLANKQGDLPLHYAIKSGRIQVAKWLLEQSPYERAVNAINNFGRAPIHLAVLRNNPAMVDYLIKNGANLSQLVKVRDKDRKKQKLAEGQQQVVLVNNNHSHSTKSGSTYHYETALDMARRLNHCECLKMLAQNQAPSAEQVLELRNREHQDGNRFVAKRSLFDMQSADGTSPIGFETSTSSVSSSGPSPLQIIETAAGKPSPMATNKTKQRPSNRISDNVPRDRTAIKTTVQPAPPAVAEQVPQSDESASSGSSMSQSSITSVRRSKQASSSRIDHEISTGAANHRHDTGNQSKKSSQVVRQTFGGQRTGKPYKGGISYHNNHINASIKCKLYGHGEEDHDYDIDASRKPAGIDQGEPAGRRQSSFPPMTCRQSCDCPPEKRLERNRSGSCSATGSIGQEIVTNVNVYTSPCRHCAGAPTLGAHQVDHWVTDQRKENGRRGTDDTDEYDERDEDESAVSEASTVISPEVPPMASNITADDGATCRQQPDDIDYTHHDHRLPVILSEQERSNSVTSNEAAGSGKGAGGDCQGCATTTTGGQQQSPRAAGRTSAHSPSIDEPRFDRSQRGHGRCRLGNRYREQVRSPVAEYIRAPLGSDTHYQGHDHLHHQHHHPHGQRASSTGRHREYSSPDVGHARPKVDSHWARDDDRYASSVGHQSRSSSRQANHHRHGHGPRSHSQRCRSSVSGGAEALAGEAEASDIASSIERSIWKYKQESKLFDELKNLKRSQIRSGRANEVLLVKRLAERFMHDDVSSYDTLLGLDTYNGPYTYKSYESYLYEQLRKLSKSNSAKLAEISHLAANQDDLAFDPHHLRPDHQEQPLQQQDDHSPELRQQNEQQHLQTDRDYLAEDLKAELELRRLIDTDSGTVLDTPETSVQPTEGQEQMIREMDQRDQPTESEDGDGRLARESTEQTQSAQQSSSEGAGGEASSVASSRRSSVDVEREKLKSLPLKVSSSNDTTVEQPVKDVLDEASSLASTIVVDALDNIDQRVDSPKPSEKEPVEQEAGPQEVGAGAQPDAAGGRRRSVVNIGNKIEVIYHDVGIEIDRASDRERASLDGSELTNESEDAGEVDGATQVTKIPVKSPDEPQRVLRSTDLEDVAEDETQESGAEAKDVCEAGEVTLGDQEAEAISSESESVSSTGTGGTHKEVEQVETVGEVEKMAKHSLRRRRSSSPALLGANEEQRPTMPRSTRRATVAPKEYLYDDDDHADSDDERESDNDKTEKEMRERGETSQHPPVTDSTGVDDKQRVFNGYDLDKLHRQRQLARQVSSEEKEQEMQQANEGDMSGEPQVVARRQGRPQDDWKRKLQRHKSVSPPPQRRRRRLERSRLPSKDLIIRIPIDEIRARWSEIKNKEKRKRRRKFSRQQDIDDLSSRDSLRSSRQMKSQPELRDRSIEEDGDDQDDDADEYSNYILIYEVNKGLRGLGRYDKSQTKILSSSRRMDSNQQLQNVENKRKQRRRRVDSSGWLCRSRVVRIVDSRTLKRTSSLPESLIYSNDLLKRFNILKL